MNEEKKSLLKYHFTLKQLFIGIAFLIATLFAWYITLPALFIWWLIKTKKISRKTTPKQREPQTTVLSNNLVEKKGMSKVTLRHHWLTPKKILLSIVLVIATLFAWYITLPALLIWWLIKTKKISRKAKVISVIAVVGAFIVLMIVMSITYSRAYDRDEVPSLQIIEPAQAQVIKNSIVVIKGNYQPSDRRVWINDKEIIASNGSFEVTYDLVVGVNRLKIEAGNFKRVEQELTIIRELSDEEIAEQQRIESERLERESREKEERLAREREEEQQRIESERLDQEKQEEEQQKAKEEAARQQEERRKQEAEQQSQEEEQAINQQEKVIEITASQLSAEYDANKVAADSKYEDKTFKITGIINDIGKDIMDTPYVVLEGSTSSFWGVQCMFARDNEEDLINLVKGTNITLQGKISGEMIGNVIVRNCVIVSE